MKKTPPKEFLLTDQCFFEENGGGENYNPDLARKPHAVTVVDIVTGTIRLIKSGTIISIIKEAK